MISMSHVGWNQSDSKVAPLFVRGVMQDTKLNDLSCRGGRKSHPPSCTTSERELAASKITCVVLARTMLKSSLVARRCRSGGHSLQGEVGCHRLSPSPDLRSRSRRNHKTSRSETSLSNSVAKFRQVSCSSGIAIAIQSSNDVDVTIGHSALRWSGINLIDNLPSSPTSCVRYV